MTELPVGCGTVAGGDATGGDGADGTGVEPVQPANPWRSTAHAIADIRVVTIVFVSMDGGAVIRKNHLGFVLVRLRRLVGPPPAVTAAGCIHFAG